jgi:hypothetical protein
MIHVYDPNDEFDHDLTKDGAGCSCDPRIDFDEGIVVLHRHINDPVRQAERIIEEQERRESPVSVSWPGWRGER